MKDLYVSESLLQVTIGDRAIILDLKSSAEWIKDFSEMKQLLGP